MITTVINVYTFYAMTIGYGGEKSSVNPGTPEYRNTYKKTFFVTYL